MSYKVKEIFYSIQGEGFHAGRPAVFCRFTGCNLWSGKEADRSNAVCQFCDTDFVGGNGPSGGRFQSAAELAGEIAQYWPKRNSRPARPFVVCTGGEPLLQLDHKLISALHEKNFEIAVETNGTIIPLSGIDWICVSPKAGAPLRVLTGHELKLVYPQPGAEPEKYQKLSFQNFFLQPLDGSDREANTKKALKYVLAHPRWRISLQLHKMLGVR